MPTDKTIKSAFESMMFVWGEPLDVKIAASAMDVEKAEAKRCFEELKAEYDEAGRGIRIREVDGKYQLVTAENNHDYIRTICTPVKERRLSQAALEVLAIVAYKQPVTKGEIDSIRGIKSDRVLEGLARKNLVEEKGRSAAVGRPILYGTTENFLASLDLSSLKELPEIDDLEDAITYEEYLDSDGYTQTRLDILDGEE
ncbi:MAG: SMC-Scp complex subunit ScpB [Clostridiales Family XIII bacterium]|jgi:segregation and condensation protein B|nr:SMC-Scp complex subunit ScpB [Clostridiales Family XIII bacterium]